jgi:hypothetical protein
LQFSEAGLTATPFIDRLYQALDDRRQERGLTWQGLVREVNAPFQPTRYFGSTRDAFMRHWMRIG